MNYNIFSKIWIIIIFASFICGGILIWQYFEIRNNERETTEKILEDETADWKTYKSEEYGFEVKYPNDWEKCFSEDEKIILRIIPPISDSDITEGWDADYFKSNACMYGSVEFDIKERKNFNLEELKKHYSDLYKDDPECNPENLIKETIFNGYPALNVDSCDLSGMYSGTMTVFLHDQTEFRIHVSSSVVRVARQEIIDKIFSSFRFLTEGVKIKTESIEEQMSPIINEKQETQEPYNEQQQRDAGRKADIGQIVMALEIFYSEIGEYAQIGGTATMPQSIGVEGVLINESVMAEISKDPVSGKNYIWVDNTKDSSKFCIYAELEQGGYYAESHKGRKTLDFEPTNLSCW